MNEKFARSLALDRLSCSKWKRLKTDTESEIGGQTYFFKIAGNDLER